MNDLRPAGGPDAPPTAPLPDLNEAELDWPGVEALLRDIEVLTEVAEILVKTGPRQMVADAPPLTVARAREILRQGRARAVQIRYRHEGADWWDTLAVTPAGWKLVRIRHVFPAPDLPS
jgi:hypothetical protein